MDARSTAAPGRLAARIDAALPQTQCTRCGEPDCAAYAAAVAVGTPHNRCPPGGAEGVRRLAELTGRPVEVLDPAHGREGPRLLAWVDEAACIGCTLCIQACPVDCIVGAPKRMHTVVEDWCTGCELCVPACPVDCIHLEVATPGQSGWAAWSPAQAEASRARYARRRARLGARSAPEATETGAGPSTGDEAMVTEDAQRAAAVAAALARARERRR